MSRGRDVLIVDDDADARELFAFVLRDAGAHVVTVDSGEAAVRAALALHPDLIMTDLAMPRMDGLEVIRRLRQQEPTKGIPVVAVTGQALADFPEQAEAAGCNAVLEKPCPPDALVQTMNRHIGRRAGDRPAIPPHQPRCGIHERRRPSSLLPRS